MYRSAWGEVGGGRREDGGGRRGDAGAPARSPFSTSSSSSISIYLPALLLYPPPFSPYTHSVHPPPSTKWMADAGVAWVYVTCISPHRRTPTRVYVCARAKMVGPTSHLRFKHLLPLSPVRLSLLPRKLSPFPPLYSSPLPLLLLFFRAPCIYIYIYI